MYDDVDYRFNWVKLIIKVVIFIILIALAVLVISKTITKTEDDYMDKNMKLFKEAATQYFTEDKLPEKLNDTEKVTLKELIAIEKIDKLVDGNDKSCDVDKSYAGVTKLKENYELMLKLYCGDKSKIAKSTIKNKECTGDSCSTGESTAEEDKEEKNESNNNSSSNSTANNTSSGKNNNDGSSNASTNTETKKQTYYEYVKVNKVYSEWQMDKLTGDNVEKTTKKLTVSNYCEIKNVEYYSTGYVTKVMKPYTYSINLLDIPSDANLVRVNGTGHFDNNLSMYRAYLKGQDISFVTSSKENYGATIPNVYTYRDSSLKSNNFSFSVSKPYLHDKNYRVDITINIENLKNVESYYDARLKMNIYFVPVYFYGEYVDTNSCLEDTNENAVSHMGYKIMDTYTEKVTVYRSYSYEKDYNDVKWSTESSLDGYEKTGKSELR